MRLLDRYVALSLSEVGIKIVLDLPPGVTWQPDSSTPAQSRVTVRIEGEPGPGEMSLAGLEALNETMDEVREAN